MFRKWRKSRQPIKLKWSISIVMALCWMLPLILLSIIILVNISDKMQEQTQDAITTSADRAVEVCEMRLASALTASRKASYIPTLKNSWLEYEKNPNTQKLYNSVSEFLYNEYKYTDSFLNAMVYFCGEPERLYYTQGMYAAPTYDAIRYFKTNVWDTVRERAEDLGTDISYVAHREHLYIVRNIVKSNYEPCAVVILELDKEAIFKSLESIGWYVDANVFLDGQQVLGEGEEKPILLEQEKRRDSKGKSVYYASGDKAYVYNTRNVYGHSVEYVVELDLEKLSYQHRSLLYMTGVMILFTVPLMLLMVHFLNINVTVPVNKLIQAARQIEKGNFGYKTDRICINLEFMYLGDSFNDMSDRLKNQFEKIYQEELALRDAQIMALQSQINPHFLNNTLEIINWEARIQGNDKVSGMIEALSVMLEATMNRKKQELIPLAEELSYVDAYCYIIRQRFGESFALEKRIDQTLMRTEVPRLIIQPLVENAVEHGVTEGKRFIRIQIYAEGDKGKISIINSGTLSPKDKERIAMLLSDNEDVETERSLSLGIRNVNKRLKIIYGPECGLTIHSGEDGFTVSTITVRLNK